MNSSANTFGSRFCVHTFGESHGAALGALIDGCPAGVCVDLELLSYLMGRRRPGSSAMVSSRSEEDRVDILSGVYEGKTLGTPIAMMVRNQDARSHDYKNLPLRSGHADDTWKSKFQDIDPRGGGRSSGRETVARVMAGAVAEMFLKQSGFQISVTAFARSIGPLELRADELISAHQMDRKKIDSFAARFPSPSQTQQCQKLLESAKLEGKSYGGVVELLIAQPPKNLGQPVFRKLKSDLVAAFMSVGASCGVEMGAGFAASLREGSEFHQVQENQTQYGGIRGGISTGEDIVMRVAFKPTASVLDVAKKGRHDPCIVPRAIAVLEAMAWLVFADHVLWSRQDRID